MCSNMLLQNVDLKCAIHFFINPLPQYSAIYMDSKCVVAEYNSLMLTSSDHFLHVNGQATPDYILG